MIETGTTLFKEKVSHVHEYQKPQISLDTMSNDWNEKNSKTLQNHNMFTCNKVCLDIWEKNLAPQKIFRIGQQFPQNFCNRCVVALCTFFQGLISNILGGTYERSINCLKGYYYLDRFFQRVHVYTFFGLKSANFGLF